MMLLLVPGWAQAGVQVAGYDVETAVYKDLRQDLTIDTVPGVSFSPVSGRFGLGFEAPITWVRLTLRPIDSVVDRAVDRAAGRAVDLAQPLVLRVGPYMMDKLDFYQQVDGRWVVEHVGDLRPRIKTSCIDDLYCFAVHPPGKGETVRYLRIETTGFPFVTTEILPVAELTSASVKRLYFLSASLVAGSVLLLVGLMMLVLERTALLKIYCSHQVIVSCLFFARHWLCIGC